MLTTKLQLATLTLPVAMVANFITLSDLTSYCIQVLFHYYR